MKDLGATLVAGGAAHRSTKKATITVLERHVAELAAADTLLRAREQFNAFMDHLEGFAWIKDDRGMSMPTAISLRRSVCPEPASLGRRMPGCFPAIAEHFTANDGRVPEQ